MTAGQGYNLTELLACVAASLLENGSSVFVGTGLPLVAGMLAQRTHAPGLLIIFEAGGIGPQVPSIPISVGDSRTYYKASAASSMHDVMSASQAGYVDYGFLGGAAMDCFGNVNTTVIGDWSHPKVRLPGSGGANDVGSFCWRTIYLMRQQCPRTFVKKLDFITTPGYLTGPGARERVGLPAGNGPYRVITQLGVYGFDEATKRLKLLILHPGVTVQQVQEASEFEILIPDGITISSEPTLEQVRILREIDPRGLVIGK
jgi:acyl CoA:acetate/3-ketoacid CoA transferase beta subunit